MYEKITLDQIRKMETRIESVFGYKKFQIDQRYGYIAIDEFKPNGSCYKTFRAGLTKREAYHTLYCLWYAVDSLGIPVTLLKPNKEVS